MTPEEEEVAHGAMLSDVSVVVLCHNRYDRVVETVSKWISEVHADGPELIVVDNASSDGTREWLEAAHRLDPCFHLVVNTTNLGVAGGRNSGWSRSTRAYILTVDEDVKPSPEQIAALVHTMRSRNDLGIVHPIVIHSETRQPLVPLVGFPHQATNFQGACYLVRRDVLEAVGHHDPLCDFGGEELDLSIRVRAAGFDVLQIPTIEVEHPPLLRPRPVTQRRRSRWTQNHVRVLWRHFPARRALHWSLIMLASEARAAVRRREIGDLVHLLWAWVSGVREGRSGHARVPDDVTAFYAGRLGLMATVRRTRGRAT
jgi:GT2 family glycosyltransferase